jgi:hypothetical protein
VTPSRHHLARYVVAGALVVAAVLAIVLTVGGDDGAPAVDDAVVAGPEASTSSTLPGDVSVAPGPTTEAGPPCDDIGVHSSMAMWNPTLADEMLALDCPWPWDPALQGLEGGEEDPAIAAPFEGHAYAEVFALLDAERFGTCQVAAVPADPATGVVFGFDLSLRAETCVGGLPDVVLAIDEYATRAHRDAAAGAADGALVLGRWTLGLTGTDTASIDRLTSALTAAGAVPAP